MITQFDDYYVRILTISTDIFTIDDITHHLFIFFVTTQAPFCAACGGEGKGKEARTPRAPARGLRPPAPPTEQLLSAAAGEEEGKEARTPRAPARGLRPPAPPTEQLLSAAAGEEEGKEARTPRAPARGLRPPAPPAEELLFL